MLGRVQTALAVEKVPAMKQDFGKSKGGKRCVYCGNLRATLPFEIGKGRAHLWIHAACTAEARAKAAPGIARKAEREEKERAELEAFATRKLHGERFSKV